ncbi:MAG: hypothetical protein M3Y05_16700 [Gemmatimonadota bacterium]|nr:hypothetical protein [Gemmatimonadota bacterium]
MRRARNRGAIGARDYAQQLPLLVTGALGFGIFFATINLSLSEETGYWVAGVCVASTLAVWLFTRTTSARLIGGRHEPVSTLGSEDIRLLLEKAGSVNSLASLLGASMRDVKRWAAGETPVMRDVPPLVSRAIDALRTAALVGNSGLPEFAWMKAAWPTGSKEPAVSDVERDAHVASCETCKARRKLFERAAQPS